MTVFLNFYFFPVTWLCMCHVVIHTGKINLLKKYMTNVYNANNGNKANIYIKGSYLCEKVTQTQSCYARVLSPVKL